jgi:hypothetical protein
LIKIKTCHLLIILFFLLISMSKPAEAILVSCNFTGHVANLDDNYNLFKSVQINDPVQGYFSYDVVGSDNNMGGGICVDYVFEPPVSFTGLYFNIGNRTFQSDPSSKFHVQILNDCWNGISYNDSFYIFSENTLFSGVSLDVSHAFAELSLLGDSSPLSTDALPTSFNLHSWLSGNLWVTLFPHISQGNFMGSMRIAIDTIPEHTNAVPEPATLYLFGFVVISFFFKPLRNFFRR